MLGIYCRTSKERDIETSTISQQKTAGIKFAEGRKFEYQIYEDGGKSGFKISEDDQDPFNSKMIICLLACGGRETISVYQRKKANEWQEKECSNIVLKSIEWIKNSLDVWDITELEAEKFTEHLYLRKFLFERKDVDFALDGVITLNEKDEV